MELGNWALISSPSLWALLPLLVYLVVVFCNKSNLAGLIAGTVVGVILCGLNLQSIASLFTTSLTSSLATIGLIVMFGSGLGYLMNKTKVTHTLVYWIVKKIGVDTEKKGMLAVILTSIIVCGLLGTLAGGNAVIAPVLIPIVATVGLTPTAVTSLLRVSGEVGLIMGPLTGVTLTTMKVTGLSYGKLMIWAVIPFSVVWIGSTLFAVCRYQKKYKGKEVYEITDDMVDINNVAITKREKITTIVFILSFLALVGYGIITKQGTSYAIIVILLLSAIISIASWLEIDTAISTFTEGAAKMTGMFLIFILFDVMFSIINLGGGFDALSNILKNLISGSGKAIVMMVASVVGGFGIEAAAVAEIELVNSLFIDVVKSVGLPMTVWATAILAATRITGSVYPTANLAGQMGIARSSNMKDALKICWFGAASLWVWVIVWSFVGPLIAGL